MANVSLYHLSLQPILNKLAGTHDSSFPRRHRQTERPGRPTHHHGYSNVARIQTTL
jgi:hypothetical protein